METMLSKIIVILGPTASGKTDLGLELAKKFNGEIISADSRQVYKKMNIGTAKPSGEWCELQGVEAYFVNGIAHHMIDIVDPRKNFSLADYKIITIEIIKNILNRGKLPILVGGTGLYIWSIVDNLDIPKIAPNKEMRKQFEKKTNDELVELLKQLDPESAKRIDLKNPRRVLRALEVFTFSGESFFKQRTKSESLYNALQIGINLDREELYDRIEKRVDKQIEQGLIEETKELAKKYRWTFPSMSGIGYKQIGYFLRGEMSLEESIIHLKRDTKRYAKRQMTWFKRDKRINWIKNSSEAVNLVKKFISAKSHRP